MPTGDTAEAIKADPNSETVVRKNRELYSWIAKLLKAVNRMSNVE